MYFATVENVFKVGSVVMEFVGGYRLDVGFGLVVVVGVFGQGACRVCLGGGFGAVGCGRGGVGLGDGCGGGGFRGALGCWLTGNKCNVAWRRGYLSGWWRYPVYGCTAVVFSLCMFAADRDACLCRYFGCYFVSFK